MTGSPTADTADERARVAADNLAAQAGVDREEIARLVAYGLIGGPDAAGTYDAGDITRLRLIKALQDSGVGADRLAAAVADRRLSLEFAGSTVADPVGLSSTTFEEACAAANVTPETFQRLMLALGFPTPAPSAPIRDDDLEFVRIYAAARDMGIAEHVILSTLRSYAISVGRLVEASRGLVREQVEGQLLARGMPYAEMFAAAARMRVALQRFAYRTTYLLQRRLFEQAVYDNLIARFEEALEERPAAPRRVATQAICFVDLSGFTERTESLGDADAASIGAALVGIAQGQATLHGGNLVKPLGDGAMLHFVNVARAVRCAVRIVATARESSLPPARAGVAAGPLIVQDGDYYGRTVNRAARLLGVAQPEQVLVTAEIAAAVVETGLRFDDLGLVRLKGVNEEVHAFAAAIG